MKYTIKDFKRDFPSDDVCLDYIFKNRFSDLKCPNCGKNTFYRVKNRKAYACKCGYQVSPTANTIFHKSDTNLTDWFFVIYLTSQSKNGLSAKEIQRHLGCTYKTAWRIGYKIRSLMTQGDNMLSGTVEADETYVGGKSNSANRRKNKGVVMAIVQRKGQVKSKHIPDAQTHTLLKMLKSNVTFGSRVITDDTGAYKPRKIGQIGMLHDKICHSKEKYVKGDIYTNTVEGFFSQFKRSIDGTYHSVSLKHLQSYVDQFSYHYNHRLACFHDLLGRLCRQHDLRGQRIGVFEGAEI
jgi:predicted RNA-binding Zn-ribbon protein involved in translation (DUF1610 family)/transposase-like protein